MERQHDRTAPGTTTAAWPESAPGTRAAFRVTVTKDYLVFASAHFITYEGHKCETLHGHNYRVTATLEGGLDPESWYVFDFVALKKTMKGLCDELDHRVLLPLENPRLTIEERDDMVSVAYDGRPRYLFPRRDCVLLPIPNSTVEMLAVWLTGRLREEVRRAGATHIQAIEMEVEENFGQSAIYREESR
ncbi:MAG TPA: 6-carboxytetrahydropterin synthase [Gemmatimonadaceae bacterium]|nr:6-carboxytetrahydropterin synthase [Gemmatimonadaceae bacterium]